jgi:hypothetical protein
VFNQVFRLNDYERIMYRGCTSSHVAASVLAGASRSLREEWCLEDDFSSTSRVVAADVIAPLLFGYALWIIESAQRDSRSLLFFMARDGLIIKKAVDVLIARWQLPIKTHYLYCSRESLMLPSYSATTDFEFDWITWGYLNSITLRGICQRIGLDFNDLFPYLEGDLLAVGLDDNLSSNNLVVLRTVLVREVVECLIRKKNVSLKERAIAFFSQEGFVSDSSWAIVDTGWKGRSQYALSSLLDEGGIRPSEGVVGYYLGLNKGCCSYGNDNLSSYLFDWRNEPVDYFLSNFLCFELLFSSGSSRTIGYQTLNNKIIPVFGVEPSAENKQLAQRQHEIVVEYLGRVTGVLRHGEVTSGSIRLPVCKQMRRFISFPDSKIASVYGQMKMASEMCEGDIQEMAPHMSFFKLLKSVIGVEKINGYWPQASMKRGGLYSSLLFYNFFLRLRLLDWYRRVILKY